MDGFQDIVRSNFWRAREVGEGAENLEDAIVGAGGEIHLFHRLFDIAAIFSVELAPLTHLLRSHRGVGGKLSGLERYTVYRARRRPFLGSLPRPASLTRIARPIALRFGLMM